MAIIEEKAKKAEVDLNIAMEDFKKQTLRGKAPVGPEDWKVN